MINTVWCLLTSLFLANTNWSSQEPPIMLLNIDLSASAELPELMVIKRHGLGDYEMTTDTTRITDAKFTLSLAQPEPEIQDVILIWPGVKRKVASFRAFPSNYLVSIDHTLKLTIKNAGSPDVAEKDFHELEELISDHQSEIKSLVGKVNYENRNIEDVEREINTLKDSMEMVLDVKVYRQFVLSHLNSPAGLFALTKYAERPLEKQRRKWAPGEIESLMSLLHPRIKKAPTFSLLADKLFLAQSFSLGKKLKDVSLLDTVGKSVKISDFKGSYLLVEFWASWCGPCREESSRLIRYFNKYQAKGFKIVGITLNKLPEKNSWLKAIKDDGVGIWPQLSDFDDLAQETYDIKVIPSNFLLDPNGNIIAFDLRGNNLETKLREIME